MFDKTKDLVSIVSQLQNGETLTLERDVVYDVWQDKAENIGDRYSFHHFDFSESKYVSILLNYRKSNKRCNLRKYTIYNQ